MSEQMILLQLKELPESLKKEIMDYIEFLILKYQKNQSFISLQNTKERPSYYGNAKEEVIMSDDFDEPLADFAEYM